MPIFDAYIFVDWSAASRRNVGPDSIWIAEGYHTESGFHVQPVINPPFRDEATRYLISRLIEHTLNGRRILIGIDFPYGYPYGFAKVLGFNNDVKQWHNIWQYLSMRIIDRADNKNNRFDVAAQINGKISNQCPGPFWGCPNKHDISGLTNHRKNINFPYVDNSIELTEFRHTEEYLRCNHGHPSSPWQLYGAGSVGSQALIGIPRLEQMLTNEKLEKHSVVWPFDTGWEIPDIRPLIVHAEIYPAAIDVDITLHDVRDAAQVLTLMKYAQMLDERNELSTYFNRPLNINDQIEQQVLQAEGWILWA